MICSPVRILLVLLVVAAAALGEIAAPPSKAPAPIVNFSLPTFTPEGFRLWLIRGSEASLTGPNNVDVNGLSVTIFSGDAANRIETMVLSPSARVNTDTQMITGNSTVRLLNLNDGFEASGENWRYTDKNKTVTVTLGSKVRVVLRAEFKNFLK